MAALGYDTMSAVPVELNRDTLLAFRNRRWDLVREAKESFWSEETRTRGPAAGFGAGEAMWMHARALDLDWPHEEARMADFRHHVEMSARFSRIADALARR